MACDVEFGISFLKEIPSIQNGGRIEEMGEIIHCWDYWNLNTHTHTHSCFEVCKIIHIWWETPIFFRNSGIRSIQESYNTPRYRTPQAIPLPNYERIPFTTYW